MHRADLYRGAILSLFCFVLLPGAAAAQANGYIAGAGFADTRLFGGPTTQTPVFDEDASRDATGAGGSVRVGTWLHPRWTLEVGADVSSTTSTTVLGPVIAIFPPVPPLEITSSTSFTSVTTLLGFHSPASRRVRLGYLAGFSFVRATYKTELPSILLPRFTFEGLGAPFGASLTSFTGSSLTLPASALRDKRNSGALTLGFEAAIGLTSRIAVVPEVRASTFSTSGSGVFLIRPGVGVRWSF